MPETVTVRRKTDTQDPTGGTTTTWADTVTVSGRIDPAGGTPEERVIADRIQATTPYTVTVPHGTDVFATDQLTIDGETYEVVGVIDGSWVPNPKVVCTRVG